MYGQLSGHYIRRQLSVILLKRNMQWPKDSGKVQQFPEIDSKRPSKSHCIMTHFFDEHRIHFDTSPMSCPLGQWVSFEGEPSARPKG
jgi:hypothetical protein